MKQLLKTLTALISLTVLIGCNEEVLPPESEPEFAIEGVKVPLRLNVGNPRDYDVSFRVTHPEGASAIAQVTLTFYGSDQATQLLQLPLYDDGGFLNDDHDVIAGDGIFTNHFVSDSLVFPLGTVFMRVEAIDNAQENLQTDFVLAEALINAAPVLLSVDVPDTLYSGSQPVLFSVAVQDSNDIEDVTAVTMRLKRGGSEIASYLLEFQSKTAADSGVFGAFFDSTFAAERDSLYTLEFQAVDLSDDVSEVLAKTIFMENKSPQIYNLSMVDSLLVPPTGEVNLTLIEIKVDDPQGLMDIDSVYFNSILPNGQPSSNNPFLLYDNGLPFNPGGSSEEAGDLVAGDGIYSITIALQAGTPTGAYTFSFYTRDKVGHLTVGPVDSLIVYQ